MGCWEETCFICGCGVYNYTSSNDTYKWLTELVVIASSEEILIGGRYNSYGKVVIGDKKYYVSPNGWYLNENKGLMCHKDCYNLLSEKNYVIKFSNLHKKILFNKLFKYNVADIYKDQVFDYVSALENDPHILLSPLKNKKNYDRILAMWEDEL